MISQTLGDSFAESFARRNVALQKPSKIRPPSFLIMSQDKHRYGIIYCITSRRDGMRYIGKTIRSLDVRINEHFNHKQESHLHRAMRKHGRDNFAWLEVCSVLYAPGESFVAGAKNSRKDVYPSGRQCLKDLERYLIRQFGTMEPHGYNLTEGGEGDNYFSPATCKKRNAAIREALGHPKVKAKRSASQLKRWNRPGVKEKFSTTIRSALARPEVKAKMSDALRKAWGRPGAKAKRSAITRQALSRPEVKEKLSVASRESQKRPDVKAKHRAAVREARNRPEVKDRNNAAIRESLNRPDVKAKMSASTIETWNRPGYRAKMSAIQRDAKNRPEVKAKNAAAQRIAQNRPEVRAKFATTVAAKRAARGLTPQEIIRLDNQAARTRASQARKKATAAN